jgi:rubrerythrin
MTIATIKAQTYPHMMNIVFYKAPRAVLEKMNRLLVSLRTAKKMYELTASALKNQQLKNTVLGLAQENKQYAEELAAHLQLLGGDIAVGVEPSSFRDDLVIEKREWEIPQSEKEAVDHCAMREKFTEQLYEDMLKEPSLHENLRKMIVYQLQGVMHSLSQMTLLSSSLVRG